MEKKKQLLHHYHDFIYDNLAQFEGLQDEVDFCLLLNYIDKSKKSIHHIKSTIDNFYKKKILRYLNNKYQKIKESPYYQDSNFNYFKLEYQLCKKVFQSNNYRLQVFEPVMEKLNSTYTIEDCKKIVLDFYTDLLKEKDDIEIVKELLEDVTFDDVGRSYMNLSTLDIVVNVRDEFEFIVALAHEISHAYTAIKADDQPVDLRLIEMISNCIELLFFKYLKDNKIKVIEDEDGPREITDQDIEDHFTNNYTNFVFFGSGVVDEINLDNCMSIVGKKEINEEVFNYFREVSDYKESFLVDAFAIDDCLDRYILDDSSKNNEKLSFFKNNVSYICSILFSNYFSKLIENEDEVEKFLTFFDNPSAINFYEFLDMFGLSLKDFHRLTGMFIDRVSKNSEEENKFIISSREMIKEDLEEMEKIITAEKNGDTPYNQIYKLVDRLSVLLDTDDISLDIYPFDISYQMDDNEVEEFHEIKKKLLTLSHKE